MPGMRARKKKRDRDVMYRRKDVLTRLVVDIGLNYLPTLGIEKAAEFLRENDVPDSVALRVLTKPQLRRAY